MVGFETEIWVSDEHYERAMALTELLRLTVLTAIPEQEAKLSLSNGLGECPVVLPGRTHFTMFDSRAL